MVAFIHEKFLLQSNAARRLYHDCAEHEPILDFHTHLPAAQIAEDHRFRDLTELCLEGDHYKLRLMRANGIPERYCTGDATPFEKFEAWAKTVPLALRNPLYQWTHLELQRYFGIDLLNENTAKTVWENANSVLSGPELSVRGILKKFYVRVVCTTDDPCDDLKYHRQINAGQQDFRVYPTFRPDKALQVQHPEKFNAWIEKLEQAANVDVQSLNAFLNALKNRHDAFHAAGGRMSDHGLPYCYATPCSQREAARIFDAVRSGKPANPEEHVNFASFLMLFFGQLDAEKQWTKQLHLGALRSVNSRRTQELGPDTGFDNLGDWRQAEPLCGYLDLLERENALPRMILYNVNPADDYAFATIAGSFNDGVIPGKIQYGSAWWFLDQKDGIEAQLNALSNTGLLSRFVGMVTDSRSFMSFPRHEYFRRVLCNLLGAEIERGELPNDFESIGAMVRAICFSNAKDFLRLELPAAASVRGAIPRSR